MQVGLIELQLHLTTCEGKTGQDLLTADLGNICKLTTTGCHGNFSCPDGSMYLTDV